MIDFILSDEVSIVSLVIFCLMLAACVWLYFFAVKAMRGRPDKLPLMHEKNFDGIVEGEGRTPFGMHIMMGALILFSIWYVAFGYPIQHSHSQEWYAEEAAQAKEKFEERFADADIRTLSNIGESVFNGNCAVCHGPYGQQGTAANLVEFGSEEHIVYVIKNGSTGLGYLSPLMPAQWDELGANDEQRKKVAYDVAAYVMSLAGAEPNPQYDINAGKQTFIQSCAACHSSSGVGRGPNGDIENFAPNLTLYGHPEYIEKIVRGGKKGYIGVMPSFTEVGNLSPTQIKAVSIYVNRAFNGL